MSKVEREPRPDEGSGMPMPARGKIVDLYHTTRDQISSLIDQTEKARDAKIASGLLAKREEDQLRLASKYLVQSWDEFDKYNSLLMRRFSDDDPAQAGLVAILAAYLGGLSAIGEVSKLCGLPTIGDIRAIDKVRSKAARLGRTKLTEERRAIVRPLIKEATVKAGGAPLDTRTLFKAMADALTHAGLAQVNDRTLERDVSAVQSEALQDDLRS